MPGPWYRAIPTQTAERTCTNVATFDTAYAASAGGPSSHDRIIMSAGTYVMKRTIAKQGLQIFAAPGAHVIIQGRLDLTGQGVIIKDLDIANLDETQPNVTITGADCMMINCYSHDCFDDGLGHAGQCILTSAASASNILVYGNICTRSRHVVYPQNHKNNQAQWWAHNYIGDVTDIGGTGNALTWHCYSSSGADNVNNMKVHENIITNGGSLCGADGPAGICHDLEFTNNRFFDSSYRTYGKPQEVKFNNNHWYEGGNKIVEMEHLHGTAENTYGYFHGTQFKNNLLYRTTSNPTGFLFLEACSYVGGSHGHGTRDLRTDDDADNNAYYGPDFFSDLITGGVYSGASSLASWRTLTSGRGEQWDLNSTYTNGVPPNRFDLWQNDYDPDRALLFVIRYSGANVPVTLARTGSLYDATDPWGAALYSGASSYNVTQTPGFFLVKYDAVGGGGGDFPVVEDVVGTAKGSFNPASWNVNMPATVNAGELLLMLEGAGQDETGGTITPSGWTQINELNDGSTFRYHVFAKIADGTEGGGTVTITYGSTDINAIAQVYRISNWWGTIATGVAATSALQLGTAINSPALNPASWDIEKTLWLQACAHRIDQYAATDIPANYTNGIKTIDTSFGPAPTAMLSCRRELEAASEDPGAQPATLTDTFHKVEATLAIRPAAGGGEPDAGATNFNARGINAHLRHRRN